MQQKLVWVALFLAIAYTAGAQQRQHQEEADIRALLAVQTQAWNSGNLDGFMQTYLKSDSLLFIGKNGVTYGWSTTLQHYKKGYPDSTAMGQLQFHILELKKLSPVYYFVVGQWHLQRTIGDLSGHFTLLLQKINGRWKIIADHSS